MTSSQKSQLPVAIDRPVSHDGAKVAELTGLDRKKVGARGYKLPDKEEQDIVFTIRTGYIRCLKAGNNSPDLKQILDVTARRRTYENLRDAIAKGNAYGTLLIPVLDKEKSPYWPMIVAVLKDPAGYGFTGLPGLRDGVHLEPTGKDAPDLPPV